MKQWLAYIFIFIFSFQVLPLKEIGKLLCKGQMTEEIHEAEESCGDSACKLKKDPEPFKWNEHSFVSIASVQYQNRKVKAKMYYTSCLPAFHVPDIFTPPPNLI